MGRAPAQPPEIPGRYEPTTLTAYHERPLLPGESERPETRPQEKLLAAALLVVPLLPAMRVLPSHADAARIAIGAYIRGASTSPAKIDAYAHRVGRRPVIVETFKDWSIVPFEGAQLRAITRRGAVPLVTWQPAA